MASMASLTMPSPAAATSPRPRMPLTGTPLKTTLRRASSAPRLPNKSLRARATSSSGRDQADVTAAAAAAAAAMVAALVIPEVAEAAQPGLSPSLRNFLLSIASGGVVLTAILGAVIGVSNFDPVKRA